MKRILNEIRYLVNYYIQTPLHLLYEKDDELREISLEAKAKGYKQFRADEIEDELCEKKAQKMIQLEKEVAQLSPSERAEIDAFLSLSLAEKRAHIQKHTNIIQ